MVSTSEDQEQMWVTGAALDAATGIIDPIKAYLESHSPLLLIKGK
jgi:hypothetical protein